MEQDARQNLAKGETGAGATQAANFRRNLLSVNAPDGVGTLKPITNEGQALHMRLAVS
ncbi:hypothetical protein FRC14_004691 [Serendipita sp. 396]|nr:hypothetical protein FRC14_004691 [Serendipita sp. 396]